MAGKTRKPGSSKPAKPKAENAHDAKVAAAATEAERDKERRTFVETMAGYGMPLEELGLLLIPPVSKADLEARYAREIEMGKAKGKAKLVGWMWSSADEGNVAARKYLHQLMVGAPEHPEPLPVQEPGETSPSSTLLPSEEQVGQIFRFPGRK